MPAAASPSSASRPVLIFGSLVLAMLAGSQWLEVRQPSLFPLTLDPASQVALPSTIPDFAAIEDVDTKKQLFFDFLQPYIDAQNLRVQQQRSRLEELIARIGQGVRLRRSEREFIRQLAEDYRLEFQNLTDQDFLTRLLRRVDVLPPSLVLAQAANESAWGTSRFAQLGNNYFGQWCYSKGCGIVPNRRRADASHEVKAFDNVGDSVAAYFRNLNTFPSYVELRLLRERLRRQQTPINGIVLAEGLESYSERGKEYIRELQAMIEYNELLDRDQELTPAPLY